MTPTTTAKEIKHAGYFFFNILSKSTDMSRLLKRSEVVSFDSTPTWWSSLTRFVMYVIYMVFSLKTVSTTSGGLGVYFSPELTELLYPK